MPSTSDSIQLPHLSPSEWQIYLVLSLSSQPLSVREIGIALATQNPDLNRGSNVISALLVRLTGSGYVRQAAAATPPAYEAAAPLEPAFRRHAERFITDLTQLRKEQIELLVRIAEEQLQSLQPPRRPRRLT